jgi:hypothetical protein
MIVQCAEELSEKLQVRVPRPELGEYAFAVLGVEPIDCRCGFFQSKSDRNNAAGRRAGDRVEVIGDGLAAGYFRFYISENSRGVDAADATTIEGEDAVRGIGRPR